MMRKPKVICAILAFLACAVPAASDTFPAAKKLSGSLIGLKNFTSYLGTTRYVETGKSVIGFAQDSVAKNRTVRSFRLGVDGVTSPSILAYTPPGGTITAPCTVLWSPKVSRGYLIAATFINPGNQNYEVKVVIQRFDIDGLPVGSPRTLATMPAPQNGRRYQFARVEAAAGNQGIGLMVYTYEYSTTPYSSRDAVYTMELDFNGDIIVPLTMVALPENGFFRSSDVGLPMHRDGRWYFPFTSDIYSKTTEWEIEKKELWLVFHEQGKKGGTFRTIGTVDGDSAFFSHHAIVSPEDTAEAVSGPALSPAVPYVFYKKSTWLPLSPSRLTRWNTEVLLQPLKTNGKKKGAPMDIPAPPWKHVIAEDVGKSVKFSYDMLSVPRFDSAGNLIVGHGLSVERSWGVPSQQDGENLFNLFAWNPTTGKTRALASVTDTRSERFYNEPLLLSFGKKLGIVTSVQYYDGVAAKYRDYFYPFTIELVP